MNIIFYMKKVQNANHHIKNLNQNHADVVLAEQNVYVEKHVEAARLARINAKINIYQIYTDKII